MNFRGLDPKTKREVLIIFCLLPVLAALLWANVVKPAVRKHQTIAKTAASQVPQPADSAGESAPESEKVLAQIQEYENKEWSLNPFEDSRFKGVVSQPPQQAASQEAATPTFHLQGIVWDPSDPYAVIDGEVRGVGDTIGEFEVIRITADRVTLQKDNEVLDLQLFPDMR